MISNITDSIRSKAEGYIDRGDLAQAEILYREILTHDDKDTDANYMLGVIGAEKADFANAQIFLNKAIEINPQFPDSYFILAKIQQAKEEYHAAYENCLKATTLDDEFDEAWLLLCSLSTWLKNSEQAVKSCKQAISYFADSVQGYSNLADALFNEHEFSEAVECYKKTILLDPENLSLKKYLCVSLIKLKEFNQVIDVAQAVLDAGPDNIVFRNFISEAYLGNGEFEKAEAASKQALAISPLNVDSVINMGNVIQKNHQYESAITWYEKALEIEPDNATIYHNLGISYFRLNNNELAAEKFAKALEINPELSVSKHMLAVAQGTNEARANNEYVADLFDEYAHRYDSHQKDLQYRVPEHVNDAVQKLYSDKLLDGRLSILDLGCGTGLCAPYLESLSSSLIGVDLSPDMVKIADKLGMYTELVVGDMSECMNARPDYFDLAVAGDVFVYIGDLDQEFQAARVSLKEKAGFVFTVQVNDDIENYELTDTGRYNHADTYIAGLIDTYGYTKVFSTNIVSRVDYGVPVNSRIYVLLNNKLNQN